MFKKTQQFDALRQVLAMLRRFKGFFNVAALVRLTGATNDVSEQITSEIIFTDKEVVDFTKKALADPDIIASANMSRSVTRGYRRRKHEVVPDHPAGLVGTQEHSMFITDLHKRLTGAVTPSETTGGICDKDAIPGNWNKLFTYSGVPMNPRGYPQCDNRGTGLAQKPTTERHRAIMLEVINQLFCQKWEPESGYEIATKSGSGFPLNFYDIEEKVDAYNLLADNLPSVLDLVKKREFRVLAKRFGVVLAYNVSRRDSNDSVKVNEDGTREVKARPAPSVGQSIGTEKGSMQANREDADKPGWFKTRSRIVYAGNGPLNYLFSAFWSPLRDYYLKRYAFALKHLSASDIARKLKGWLIVGVDAKGFDTKYPNFFAQMIFDQLESKVFTRDLVDLMRLSWRMPAYCPSPVEGDDTQGAWFGHPFDIESFRANRGLPSGIAYNPDFGKAWGLAYTMCLFDDIFHDVLEFGIPKILDGLHPLYGTLNQGDDALLLCRDEGTRSAIRKSLEDGTASPYITLTIEDPVTFLGWVPVWNGTDYNVYPNIQSMVVNFVVNEHTVNHPRDDMGHRKHWALGVESWPEVFSTCPKYDIVKKILNQTFFDHFGHTLDAIAAPYAKMSREVLKVPGLNETEARFMEKPSRRFYSVDISLVRPQLVEEVIRTIPAIDIKQKLQPYVKLAA